jgi:hypothetical protein
MEFTDRQKPIVAEIATLHRECFDSKGITRDGKRWNDENKAICAKHGITYDEWLLIRGQMILDEKKGRV